MRAAKTGEAAGGDYTLGRSEVKRELRPSAHGSPGRACGICEAVKRVLPRVLSALALVVAGLSVAPPARAYEEQLSLGVGLGYAHAVSDGLPEHGAAVGLEASVGLDDIWTVRSGLRYAFHPDDRPLSMFLADAELLYVVDVFEWVPYFGAGLDALGALRAGAFDVDFGLHPVLGLDWLPERNLAFGVTVRPVFLVTALDRDPVYFTFTVSGAVLFEL